MEITLPISSLLILSIGSIGVVVSILTSIIFYRQKKNPHLSNIFLSVLLFLSGLTLLNESLTASGISNRFKNLYFLPIFYSLSIAPLFYLFVKSKYHRSISNRDYLHLFIPAVQALIYWSIGFQTIEYKSALWESAWFRGYLTVETILFSLSLLFYSMLSMSILKKTTPPHYFWSEDLRNWLAQFTKVFIFIALSEFCLFIAEYFFGYRLGAFFSILRIIVFVAFILWIAYNTVRLFFASTIYTSKPKQEQPPFPTEELKQLIGCLVRLMEEDKVYLNSDLSLQILAKYLQTTEKKCSTAIRTGFGTNFNQFINGYRVAALKEKLKEGKHEKMTLLGLAYECGFESKSTFNRAFKQLTGVTPSQFLKTL